MWREQPGNELSINSANKANTTRHGDVDTVSVCVCVLTGLAGNKLRHSHLTWFDSSNVCECV